MTVSAITAPKRLQRSVKRCAHCDNPFGLVRRQRGGKQYCSMACVEMGVRTIKAGTIVRRWYEFFRSNRGLE